MTGYGKQYIDESDINAVVEVLRGEFLTQGPAVEQFENALCAYTGAAYAAAVNSGTAALYAVYAALKLGPGKRLWTSPITFLATVNAALMLGATVEYVDVDETTGNMDVADLATRLGLAEQADSLPDIVVPVHLAGRSCNMEAISKLSERFGFQVVEDASHALGGAFEGNKVGACSFSKASVFSFHPVKSITTAEGGAVLTNDEKIARFVREFRHHGICRDVSRLSDPVVASHPYEQHYLGFNFRLSDMQAALGVSQLKKLDGFISRRKQLAARYHQQLEGKVTRIRLPLWYEDGAWHLYPIQCEDNVYRDYLFAKMADAGINLAVHYPPVYCHPLHRQYWRQPQLAGAEAYASRTLSLPLYPSLTEAVQETVTEILLAEA